MHIKRIVRGAVKIMAIALNAAMIRALIRRIVADAADRQKYHLKVVFSDGSIYENTPLGAPDVTIVFRKRGAERRTALGGAFEFPESHFDGDVDIVGEGHAALRRPGAAVTAVTVGDAAAQAAARAWRVTSRACRS